MTPAEYRREWGFAPVFIDFEFNEVQNGKFNLICCSLQYCDCAPEEFWLRDNPATCADLLKYVRDLGREGATFVSYGSVEQQSFLSLGMDRQEILDFKWVDLHLEWAQLQNKNDARQYGKYLDKSGHPQYSVPPKLNPIQNEGKNNTKVPKAMAQAVYNMLGVVLDTQHKTAMRDICIAGGPFIPENKEAITKYCTSDIKYLPQLYLAIRNELCELYPTEADIETILQHQYNRGRTSTCTAVMTYMGQPVNTQIIKNLQANALDVQERLIEGFNKEHYPLWVRERGLLSTTETSLVKKDIQFVQLINEIGLADTWPKTPAGNLKTDEETLQKYSEIPTIKAYISLKNRLAHLRWVSGDPENPDGLLSNIGNDGRLRSYFNPYGGQTGRWQPKASSYVFLMSSAYRCLMQAPEGMAYWGLDWASQEFAIAAYLSGDRNMIEAYGSGDPYMWLAKASGAVPQDATKESHPVERDVFKICTLAKQFGMGLPSMVLKIFNMLMAQNKNLPLNTPEPTSELMKQAEEAGSSANRAHLKTFNVYWAWSDTNLRHYKSRAYGEGCLTLLDGWTLWGDNQVMTSVNNFPVQGTGAVILREAIYRALKGGYEVVAPLHDALYVLGPKDDWSVPNAIKGYMDEAVKHVLGNKAEIRVDIDQHPFDEVWIEGRAKEDYEFLRPYMEQEVSVREKNRQDFLTTFGLN